MIAGRRAGAHSAPSAGSADARDSELSTAEAAGVKRFRGHPTTLLARRLLPAITLILVVAPAFAQDIPTAVEMPMADAAKVLSAAERVPGLVEERDALKTENVVLRAQVDRLERLVALDEQIIAKEGALRGLAEQERDAYKERADRIAKEAGKANFWARVRERAAEGALIGTIGGSAIPGVGNLAGAVGGAVIGGIVGVVEHLAQSP